MNTYASQELEDETSAPQPHTSVLDWRFVDEPNFSGMVDDVVRWRGSRLVIAWIVVFVLSWALVVGLGVGGYKLGRAVADQVCQRVPYAVGVEHSGCVAVPQP